jgi:hypothetical protein
MSKSLKDYGLFAVEINGWDSAIDGGTDFHEGSIVLVPTKFQDRLAGNIVWTEYVDSSRPNINIRMNDGSYVYQVEGASYFRDEGEAIECLAYAEKDGELDYYYDNWEFSIKS